MDQEVTSAYTFPIMDEANMETISMNRTIIGNLLAENIA
jgi:hypothetical protein